MKLSQNKKQNKAIEDEQRSDIVRDVIKMRRDLEEGEIPLEVIIIFGVWFCSAIVFCCSKNRLQQFCFHNLFLAMALAFVMAMTLAMAVDHGPQNMDHGHGHGPRFMIHDLWSMDHGLVKESSMWGSERSEVWGSSPGVELEGSRGVEFVRI